MSRRNMALILIVAGIAVYFMPIIVGITAGQNQVIGAVAAIGGAIMWYIPSESQSKPQSKSKKKK